MAIIEAKPVSGRTSDGLWSLSLRQSCEGWHGEKCFISNAGIAGSYVVFAREPDGDDREPAPPDGFGLVPPRPGGVGGGGVAAALLVHVHVVTGDEADNQ
mgnify:CR=1 FL=1